MNEARKERLLSEAQGPTGGSVESTERTIAAVAFILFTLLLAAAVVAPSGDAREVVARNFIEARAAASADPVVSAAPAANATEGNVEDLTY
jgi:hypothetical protein